MKDTVLETLIDRYDIGLGGWEYHLSLRGDRVFKIEAPSLD